MDAIGERQREASQPGFDRPISIDFSEATIASDAGFLFLRQVGLPASRQHPVPFPVWFNGRSRAWRTPHRRQENQGVNFLLMRSST